MEPTADEIVSVLLLNPTLACEVVRELSEATVAAPWEPITGEENGYARVFTRKHISGTSNVATVARTTASAVWWTLDSDPQFAGSELMARVCADLHLLEHGWIIADRGYRTSWAFGTFAWIVRAQDSGLTLARVKGDSFHGNYELDDFALSNDDRTTRSKADGFPNVEVAMQAVDAILERHGWARVE